MRRVLSLISLLSCTISCQSSAPVAPADPAPEPTVAPSEPQSIDTAVSHVDADPSGQPPDRDAAENASVADPMLSNSAPAKSKVEGALDMDIIRRMVRAHMGEIRGCYNQALAKDSEAAGQVQVEFVIGPDGRVGSAKVTQTTMADPDMGPCITNAVLTWQFPKPTDGGNVTVTYPFTFASA